MLTNLIYSHKKAVGWKSQYFRNNFILILLITFIPGLVSGIGIYFLGVSKVEESLKESHKNQILQRADNINDQFDYIELSLSHWAFDSRFNSSLLDLNFVKEFKETRDIVRTLLVLQGSQPLVDHVELFVDSAQPVLFRPKYNLLEEEEYEFYHSILTYHKNISWNRFDFMPEESDIEDPTPLLLTHSIPGNSTKPFGSIIVTLNRSKVAQLLRTLTPHNEGATFLLNEDNQMLVAENSTGEASFVRNLNAMLIERFETDPEDSFIFNFGDEKYSVSYGKMKRIDVEWTYVSAAPMSMITSPIVFISKAIIIISMVGLFVALILSWIASKKIYSPVAQLVKVFAKEEKWPSQKNENEFILIEQHLKKLSIESASLQNRITTQLPQLKNNFLLQLIQGYLYNYSEQDLHNRMKNYGWELDNHSFIVLDIQVSGLNGYKGYQLKQDESLIAFAVSNITEEASKERFNQYNVINFYDLSAVLLIVYPRQKDIREELHTFSGQVMDVLHRVFQMQVTVTISKSADKIKRIPYLFEDARQGKRYRNFEDQNQVIDLQNMEPSIKLNHLHYPFEVEKEILQAIRLGQSDEAEVLIREFIQELMEKEIKEFNIKPAITQLFSSIQHEILHSGLHPYDIFDGKNMFVEVSHIGDPEQMVSWLKNEVIAPFIQTMEGKVNIELKYLVEQVCTFIQHRYVDDISLETCAAEVNTNPYTLSKAFKKVIGVNFIEYLTTIRLDKAKDLLLSTDMKINDIAEQVGYRHSYFNRIFKKHMGMPPSQYRKRRVNDHSLQQKNLQNK